MRSLLALVVLLLKVSYHLLPHLIILFFHYLRPESFFCQPRWQRPRSRSDLHPSAFISEVTPKRRLAQVNSLSHIKSPGPQVMF